MTVGADGIVTSSERLVSLDVFRGITIAGMLLVNNPGSWSHVYAPLAHAEWNGWTPADLVFPFFLFIVGVALTLSLGGKVARGASRRAMIPRLLRRTATLFALGLFLNGFPYFDLATLRIPGVLQRIAVCYLLAALIYMFTSVRVQAIVAATLIAGYWALMTVVPVPASHVEQVVAHSREPGVADPGLYVAQNANLAAYVDDRVLHGHLWQHTRTWDPEGLLSTLPAVATVLLGAFVGRWLTWRRSADGKLLGLVIGGAAAVLAGAGMSAWCPINKNLWSSSFTVFTAGMATLFLAACYWVVDVHRSTRIARPAVIYGMNAIAVFVLAGVIERILGLVRTPSGVTVSAYVYQRLFASWAGPMNGSLGYAVAFVVAMFVPAWFLHRHRIFITV